MADEEKYRKTQEREHTLRKEVSAEEKKLHWIGIFRILDEEEYRKTHKTEFIEKIAKSEEECSVVLSLQKIRSMEIFYQCPLLLLMI